MALMTPEQAKLLRKLAAEAGEPDAYKDHLSQMQATDRITMLLMKRETHKQVAAFTGRFSAMHDAGKR
jgi:hypothetical protein